MRGKMDRVFKKGQKVWVWFGAEWYKGVVREAFTDGSYLVRVKWLGLSCERTEFLEPRSGRWTNIMPWSGKKGKEK